MKKTYIKYASILGLLFILAIIPVVSLNVTPIMSTPTKSSSSSESVLIMIDPTTEPETSITYSPDGKGYLKSIGTNKNLLHVEGTPYQMGYQHGYLLAQGVSYMASKSVFKQIILGFVGLDQNEARALLSQYLTKGVIKTLLGSLISSSTIDSLFATLNDILDIVIEIVKIIINLNKGYVPSEFLQEIQGIVDGVIKRGYSISFTDVLMLNMGFDALLGFVYPVVTPILPLLELFGFHMCDAFVAYGSATSDGRTIMGRNFMFNPLGFKDYGLLIEQKPNSGNKFVSVAAPAFVGVVAAMNTKGIGVGMDMCPAIDCTPGSFGMGTLLTARKVAQYANELSEAVSIISSSKRGVSWIYVLGDGRTTQRGGCAVEVSAHYCYTRYANYAKPWYLPWVYNQIETKSDLLIVANHFIRPEINVLAGSYGISDSRWRYETLTNLALSYYGTITTTKGKLLVDYLHPPNYGYYGSSTTQPVGASRTCFDLTNLQVWSLYGYYNQEWAYYQLVA